MFSWFTKTTKKLSIILIKLETFTERLNLMTAEIDKLKDQVERAALVNSRALDLIEKLQAELEKAKAETDTTVLTLANDLAVSTAMLEAKLDEVDPVTVLATETPTTTYSSNTNYYVP
jgi:chromosome segregation ATPase